MKAAEGGKGGNKVVKREERCWRHWGEPIQTHRDPIQIHRETAERPIERPTEATIERPIERPTDTHKDPIETP